MTKTILKNGTLVTSEKVYTADILIEKGKISKIKENITEQADKVIECNGLWIMPGMIDTHVHFRDPGLTHKGDSYSESRAAIAGGVTTICDMPNTIPQTTTVEEVKKKQKLYSEKCICNFGIYIGASKDNLEELKKADKDNTIPAIKIFMAESTGDMTLFEDRYLEPIFEQTKKLIATHAEDEIRRVERVKDFEEGKLDIGKDVNKDNPYQHPLIRDNLTASQGTEKAVSLALKYNHRTHILHMSAKEELPFLQKGKDVGLVTGETCPHYLHFTKESMQDYGGFRQMNPALKSKEDQEALWKAMNDGLINQYTTDHAPHLVEEKESPYPKSPSGLPGIQFSLPILLNDVYNQKLDLKKVPLFYAENPAKNYKIQNKGFLKEGYDADIAIIDPNQKAYVTDDIVESKCKWTPYHRMTLNGGKVVKTFVNGNLVFDEGKIFDEIKGKTVEVEI